MDSSLEDWQQIWEAAQAKLQEINVPSSFNKDQKDLAQKALDDYQKAYAALADGFNQYREARQSDFPRRQPAYQEIVNAATYFDQGAKRLQKLGADLEVTDKPAPVPGFDVSSDIVERIHGLPALNRAYEQMVAIVDGPLADWAEDLKKRPVEETTDEEMLRFVSYIRDEYARRAEEVKAQPVPFSFTEGERSQFRQLREYLAKFAETHSALAKEGLAIPPSGAGRSWFEIHEARMESLKQQRDVYRDLAASTYRYLAGALNR